MYIPDAFRLTDEGTIRAVMRSNPLAALATNGDSGPDVTHLPLVARDEDRGLVLYGHFARANPHWKTLGDQPVLAIFSGAQGYITPSWYETKRETGKVVPTWNYVRVHARGVPEIIEAANEARTVVDYLTDAMEHMRNDPWKVADAPETYTEAMLRGIVAFRMVVDTLEASAKLSQNKTEADQAGVRDGLASEGAIALSGVMSLR